MANSSSSGDFTSGNNGMFANSGNDTSTAADYYSWTWKQIEAAICGGSQITDSAGQQEATALSDPSSLWTAGNTFEYVREVLNMVAQSLSDQANALAGGNDAPWQGQAAEAFLDTMTLFSKQVAANAEVLTGGAAGLDSVPQQLVDNGNALSKAQAIVHSIDTWYANQALKMGVTPMSDGLIPVSQAPGVSQMMTNDMLNYGLLPLVSNYQITIDSIVSPTPSTPGLGGDSSTSTSTSTSNPPLSPRRASSPGELGSPAMPAMPVSTGLGGTSLNPKSLDTAGLGGAGSGLGGVSPYGGGGTGNLAASPGGAGVVPPGGASPYGGSASPYGTKVLAASPAGGAGASPYGGGASPYATGALGGSPAGAGASPYGAGAPPYATGALGGSPAGIGAGSGLVPYGGGAVPYSGDELTTPLADGALPGESEGLLPAGAGVPSPLTSSKLGTSPLTGDGVSAYKPGESAVPAESRLTADAPGAGSAAGEGLPYLPGMGGVGAGAGAGGQGGERSDASGLLGGEAEPWSGDEALDGAGAEAVPGAVAGGAGLAGVPVADSGVGVEPGAGSAAGEGLPYLPGMGGVGAGAGAGGQGGERSDASGLLGGEAEPWSGDEALDGAGAEAVPGAVAGGAGLAGASVAAYLPGMAGAGAAAGAGAQDGERSDASGLLDGEAEPWSEDNAVVEPDGAALASEAMISTAEDTAAAASALMASAPVASAPVASAAVASAAVASAAVASAPVHSGPADGHADRENHHRGELPADRVAVLPQAESPDDIDAWDTALAEASLLMIADGRRHRNVGDGDIRTAKFGTEEEAWLDSPGSAAAAESAEDTGLTTWRPSTARAQGASGEELRSSDAPLRSSAAAGDEVFPEQSATEDEEDAEQDQSKEIADLLVGDSALWGSWQHDPGALE